MTSLYLTEQGSVVRQTGDRLIVCRNGEPLAELPLLKIERVIVFGHVHLTTGAISALLRHGIDTTFLSWHGRLKGRLVPLESKNIPLRLAQYERTRDQQFTIGLARKIVAAKVQSSLRVIQRYRRNHPDWDDQEAIFALEQVLGSIDRAVTLDSLRGLEGHAASIYFSSYGRMFRRSLRFDKRSRRPPRDPINAALSLGYSLLFGEAVAVVSSIGFDPYLGFLHAPDYGRCSLALDLMEEFRAAIVDRLVLTLFNNEVLLPEDFTTGEGVWFSPEAKKRFLSEYEGVMQRAFISRHTGHRTTFRRLLWGQAEHLAETVKTGSAYTPYVAEP
ncbi:MAG TPA: CRISPR-associated endonuclease Cas1 [Blastocatellia bacterium]|nr:CRISPR-associated endonuclease Cas1 [Blastocatellia bacterium]